MSMLSNVKGGVCCVPECRKYLDLPFTCHKCGQITCENHRIFQDHSCRGFYDPKIPQCPLCNQLVPCKVNEDPNPVVSRHIEKGCPKESRTVSPQPVRYNYCSFAKCTTNEHCLIVCKFCGNQYCVSHRLQEDHDCVKLREERQRKLQQKALGSGMASPQLTSSVPQVSNTPATAIGNPNVEPQDRFLLCVYFFTPESRTPPCYMFFNSNWVVGKVLDKCCEQGKVKNENNSANQDKHVHLFAARTSCILPTSSTLASLRPLLNSGDPVVLYRGTSVPSAILSQLAGAGGARCATESRAPVPGLKPTMGNSSARLLTATSPSNPDCTVC